MISTSISGTTFKGIAVESNSNAMEVSFDKEKVFKNIEEVHSKEKVVINDPITKEVIGISLSLDNLESIKKQFGESSVQTNNGYSELIGEAETFVASWYGDIAYNRDFLKSDRDANGTLDENEYQNVKNTFYTAINFNLDEEENSFSYSERVISSYVKINDNQFPDAISMDSEYSRANSISDELNTTISLDKNFDNKLTLQESFQEIEAYKGLSDDAIAIKTIQELVDDKVLSKSVESFVDLLKLEIEKEQYELQEKLNENKEDLKYSAMNKLINSNGVDNLLNEEEKEAIREEIQKVKKELTEELKDMNILDLSV